MKELRLTGVWNASSPRAETRLRQSATDRYRVSKTKSIRLRLYHGRAFCQEICFKYTGQQCSVTIMPKYSPFVLLTTGMRLQKRFGIA